MPHDKLLNFMIDEFGSVLFQNAAGMSVSGFLELLSFYLRSTFIQYDGKPGLLREGICIDSCIAPILSGMFLSKLDNTVAGLLDSMNVVRVLRFVYDYLFFLDCNSDALECRAHGVLSIGKENFRPLEGTFELPINNSIQFLDTNVAFQPDHACWAYQPRSSNPLLPFHSTHSKLVKWGIVNMCFKNAIKKSCDHSMATSLCQQSQRFSNSGCPVHLQISVAESLLKKL